MTQSSVINRKRKIQKDVSLAALESLSRSILILADEGYSLNELLAITENEFHSIRQLNPVWEILPYSFSLRET